MEQSLKYVDKFIFTLSFFRTIFIPLGRRGSWPSNASVAGQGHSIYPKPDTNYLHFIFIEPPAQPAAGGRLLTPLGRRISTIESLATVTEIPIFFFFSFIYIVQPLTILLIVSRSRNKYPQLECTVKVVGAICCQHRRRRQLSL